MRFVTIAPAKQGNPEMYLYRTDYELVNIKGPDETIMWEVLIGTSRTMSRGMSPTLYIPDSVPPALQSGLFDGFPISKTHTSPQG